MSFKLQRPMAGGGGGDRFPRDQHLEHLVLHIAEKFTAEEVETVHGVQSAVPVEHIICADCIGVWSDQLVFGAAIVPRLDGAAGVVVGRLGQGLAKPGRNPAWTLDDPTDGDLERAEQFLEQYASTLPSGRIVVDVREIERARAEHDDEEPF